MSLPRYASRGATLFLLHYVGRRAVSHLIVLFAVLAAVGCSVGAQYGVKALVDVLGTHDAPAFRLWGTVASLLALVAGDNFLWRVAGWVSTYAFVAVGGDIRLELFDHLSGHGTRYFVDRFPGALAGRITAAANAAWTIENSITWTTIPPAAAVLTSIGVLGTMNWHLTVVLLVVVAVLGVIIGRVAASNQHLHAAFAGHAALVSGDITDVVSNMGLVRAFGASHREYARLTSKIGDEMAAQRASLQSLERLRLFHAMCVFVVTAGILVWSVELWRRGHLTTGDVVLSTTLGFTLLHSSRDFAMAAVDLTQQIAKLEEAIQVLGLPHEMQDLPDAQVLVARGGRVRFSHVSFRYPNGQPVLSDFSIEVPAGQKIGLIGPSGAGKSTIISLVQRLYDPDEGRVLIDGQDISHVTQESLRCAIAVVHQDISLFHRSLLENLRYGKPEATDAEVFRAVEAARCSEFIERLPEGYNTIVGERGMKLSGGQRQRLAIARAFLRDAPIVLLDEATSALDTESEKSIQEALSRLFKGRTVIAIAHRLSTLDSFDRIVVLDRGCIIEEGHPDELRHRKGYYSRMYGRQGATVELR
ncbi:MAG: ABC transporter ATP-binding protein [Burkholderiaceae bacterium]|jgi:ATP-binding cassette subfamily B protein